MIIVGGTYSEICFEPIWENIFGSGLRAVNLILEYDQSQKIDFYTCSDVEVEAHLDYFQKLYPQLRIHSTTIFKSPIFHYDHPLKAPSIIPRLDLYRNTNISLKVTGGDILAYGMLEAEIDIDGDRVVYDPQSPVNPKPFSLTNSRADKLITVINKTEAQKIVGTGEITEIADYFFTKEKCFALIIKMGAKGALLFTSLDTPPVKIPVYQTSKIWPIGSGDVFSAFFAYSWFKGNDVLLSAQNASRATAIYCNSKDLSINTKLKNFDFPELVINDSPKGQLYLAGPFFNFAERWLINEIYNVFKGLGIKVFSPFHDVGHGKAKDVVDKDLIGLDASEVLFAVVDGLDSGTLFEIGYAIAQKKSVIAFVQSEDEESLKMLEGTDCIIERDFTTAIYKTYWKLAKR